MHTYHKLWTYIRHNLRASQLDAGSRRGSSEIMQLTTEQIGGGSRGVNKRPQFNNTIQKLLKKNSTISALKQLSYMDSIIHIVIGFMIVITVAYFCPDMINDPTRLAVFWMYSFVHLFLGFLTFLGLYQNSGCTLKTTVVLLVLLQMSVLIITSQAMSYCNTQESTTKSKMSTPVTTPSEHCANLSFASSRIVLPNFLHSLLFCGILITFLYNKSSSDDRPIMIPGDKKQFQFANIKIIVEEVV